MNPSQILIASFALSFLWVSLCMIHGIAHMVRRGHIAIPLVCVPAPIISLALFWWLITEVYASIPTS